MRWTLGLVGSFGCGVFDHTELVTVGPDPFVIEGTCTETPLVSLTHDDGSIVSSQTVPGDGLCRFEGSWLGPVLDMEDVRNELPQAADDVVAVYWREASLEITAAQVRVDDGPWEDAYTALPEGIAAGVTAFLFPRDAHGPFVAAASVAIPPDEAPPDAAANEPLLRAVEDAWYGQDPPREVMALAEGFVVIPESALAARAGEEIAVRLSLELIVSGVWCLFGAEPEAGAHDAFPDACNPMEP